MDGLPHEIDLDVTSDAYKSVESIIGATGIGQVFAPIDQPSGLPNEAYWSEDWLKLEQKRIFQRTWVFAGAERELDGAGAIKPMEIGGTPIMLVRGSDGTIRAFHNVCRHRGTQLIGEACWKKSITCPYHAWRYGLDGTLEARPHFYGADQVERFKEGESSLNLYPVRCESWNGCLFVNISGDAPPLMDWLTPMLNRTKAYDYSLIRWIGKESFTFKSNWKLVLENYMEGYHVFAAHPRLIAHAPMNVRWSGEWKDHFFYNDYVAPELTEGRGDGLPHYPDLSDKDRRRGLWFASFPNFLAEVYTDQFVVLATYPVSPNETREELHFFVVGDDAATSNQHAAGRAELIQMWHDLNMEDLEILERLQRGRRSEAFTGSVMSPAWEGPAHELSQQVVKAIVNG